VAVFWSILIAILILFVPRLMVLLANRYTFFGLLSPVFLCYLAGFLLSFIIADASFAMKISEILVPIAIPLILFTADLKSVRHLAKPILKSFVLVCVSVFLVSVAGFFLFRHTVHEADKISGMLVGLYTGGTPNLLAIGIALGIRQTDMVLINTADLVVGGLYFFALISIMPVLVKKFLPRIAGENDSDEALATHLRKEYVPEKQAFSLKMLLMRLPVLLLGVLSLGLAAGLAMAFTGKLDVMIIMLVVTTCGIGFSFVKKVRTAHGSFAMGQYLIYMFSVGIGLSFKLTAITAEMVSLLLFLGFVQTGAVVLHFMLAKIFKMDGAVTLITSTAGIYGPAFIMPVANALNRRALILPGLLCGILGYTLGNYLGISVALLLSLF